MLMWLPRPLTSDITLFLFVFCFCVDTWALGPTILLLVGPMGRSGFMGLNFVSRSTQLSRG